MQYIVCLKTIILYLNNKKKKIYLSLYYPNAYYLFTHGGLLRGLARTIVVDCG